MMPVLNARIPEQEDVGQVGDVQNIAPVCNICSRVVTQATFDRDDRIKALFTGIFFAGETYITGSLILQGIQHGGAIGGVLGAVVGVMIYLPTSVIAQRLMMPHTAHTNHHRQLLWDNNN